MPEPRGKQAPSSDPASPVTKTQKSKRKKPLHSSSDSSSKQSGSPTVKDNRPKRARTAVTRPKASQPEPESESSNAVNSSDRASSVPTVLPPKTPSPKVTAAKQSRASSPSEPCAVLLDGVAATSPSTLVSACQEPESSLNPTPKAISPLALSYSPPPSRSHPYPGPLEYPNIHTFGSSSRIVPSVARQGTGLPNTGNPFGRRRTSHSYNPSPLGLGVDYPKRPDPMMEQRARALMHQQGMARLYQEAQLHQQAQFATAHRVMLQKAARENDGNQGFFFFRNVSYTLRECLLACSLKSFCRPAGQPINDDTVAEILQHLRGWRDPNGLNCQGFCAALIRDGSNSRTQIEATLRADRHRWENYAWTSYWGWMSVMGQVWARFVGEGQLRLGAGSFQSDARSYPGGVPSLQPEQVPTVWRDHGYNNYLSHPVILNPSDIYPGRVPESPPNIDMGGGSEGFATQWQQMAAIDPRSQTGLRQVRVSENDELLSQMVAAADENGI